MKSLKPLSFLLVLCLCFAQCNRSNKSIDGKWKLKSIDMNGSVLNEQMLEGSYWQFKGDKYTAAMLNIVDEGTYRIKEDSLFLKSETTKQRPETSYVIATADSLNLELLTNTKNNLTKMSFARQAD